MTTWTIKDKEGTTIRFTPRPEMTMDLAAHYAEELMKAFSRIRHIDIKDIEVTFETGYDDA